MSSVGRVTSLDTERIRTHFPALALGVAHFDGPGGSQTPTEVAEAVAAAMTSGVSNRGTITDAELRAERIVTDARAALGALLGADPRGIVFGRSMTALTFDLARTLSADWGPGDEIVVTRLDHDANIRPWVLWAERAGATVRWLGFDPETAELDDLETVLSTRTRLVAVTAASNLFGTRPDVTAISRAAHEVDALVYVDGVHLAPHAPVDQAALGADLLACSPYKFFGPHLGAVAASPALLERLSPDKLLPSSNAVPERFELGTLPYELLAGVTACVDFIADLAPGDATDLSRPGHRVDDHRRGPRGRPARAAADRAGRDRRGHPARPPRAAYPHGAVLRRGSHRARGPRGAGEGRRERAGQQLLRDRGVPARGARRRRCGPRRDRAVHLGRGRRPARRRGGRAAVAEACAADQAGTGSDRVEAVSQRLTAK